MESLLGRDSKELPALSGRKFVIPTYLECASTCTGERLELLRHMWRMQWAYLLQGVSLQSSYGRPSTRLHGKQY
jgi:hypothetical protein